MRYTQLVALAGLLVASQVSTAQKFDSTYIQSYHDKFFLWPVLKQRTSTFKLEDPNTPTNNFEFKPNNSYGLGLGVYMFDLGLELVFGIPVAAQKEATFGKTTATDLQLNILSRRWGADLVYQRYKGFYLSNPDAPVPVGAPYPQRPDIVTETLGVSGVYVFNAHKFSLRSAFTFADRQLKGKGSFLLSGTFSNFEIEGDSAILNPAYMTLLGATNSFTKLNYRTYSVAPGYAYNFVIKKNYFFSLLFAVGPALQDFRFKDVNGVEHSNTKVNSFVDGRIAFGYSNDRFFTGVTIATQTRNVVFENVRFSSTSATFRILFGWRFRESGFLQKSVWDLLPPWGKKEGGKSEKN
jgi:hypothetical protein